ncbi:uncharacterized protein K460DRAFT_394844 [Cucurbitaria berberidis CBS 394.84]|uniref:Uncharacterized protein n=1 Tax=Cucurbitaria berberidis CBS 394.84 TaxID=1168544 RepID=A0A9P4GGP1_9PLEO|nr:uncharacterized protein K460DRAFT_394844 [Cucurbitaria berberidis CBS 394.84]KAF1845116.1 hypothetical protein K460DRAFT_394844 [Cucurbitaria berberidis CBS 394.84]
MKSQRIWTVEEKAFILNYTDVCIAEGHDFIKSVPKEFRKLSDKTLAAVCFPRQLHRLALRFCVEQHKEGADMIANGTKYLDISTLPEDLKNAMNSQRLELEMNSLDEREERIASSIQDKNPVHEATAMSSEGTQSDSSGSEKRRYSSSSYTPSSKKHRSLSSNRTPRLAPRTAAPIASQGLTPIAPNVESATPKISVDPPLDQSFLDRLERQYSKTLVGNVSDIVRSRLTSVRRIIEEDPATAFAKVVEVLASLEERCTKKDDLLNDLFGPQDWCASVTFPPLPSSHELEKEWIAIRYQIQCAAGSILQGELDAPHIANYVGRGIEDIVNYEMVLPGDLPSYIQQLVLPLWSSHAMQGMLSAVLVISLFGTPDPMHEVGNWRVDTKILEIVAQLADAKAEKQLDHASTKLLFDDQDYQDTVVRPRVDTIAQLLCQCWEAMRPSDSVPVTIAGAHSWLKRAVKLKQDMVVSPEEYRIIYCRPGMLYDPTWMRAENGDGGASEVPSGACSDRPVLTCLFPALFLLPTDMNVDTPVTIRTSLSSLSLQHGNNLQPASQPRRLCRFTLGLASCLTSYMMHASYSPDATTLLDVLAAVATLPQFITIGTQKGRPAAVPPAVQETRVFFFILEAT